MSNNTPESRPNDSCNAQCQHALSHIKVVMIQTSHTGNMGAAARAMKVMGLSQLTLVQPKSLPDEQALAMSSNASDILDNAVVVDSLAEAIADCHLVVGTSARQGRSLRWDIKDSRSCGALIANHVQNHQAPVAILFGRESSGLSNEELALCQHLVHIPTNLDYSSLNIASAVQILAYECRLALLELNQMGQAVVPEPIADEDKSVTADELNGYFEHLKQVMLEVEFLDPKNPRYLMPRLRRLYARSGVTRSELNILRGMLAAIQKKL